MPQPHAQFARQFGRQVDVERRAGGLGIAVADAVVVRPDAHPQLAPALDLPSVSAPVPAVCAVGSNRAPDRQSNSGLIIRSRRVL